MLSRATNVPGPADPAARRREAGEFLRSRRERTSPIEVGLPEGFRRRTPGLRREEVALLANVGITWYTWLEQGRDVRPSDELLSALADALRLDPIERSHLFSLYDRPLLNTQPFILEQVDEPLRRILNSLAAQPAYILGRRWDILAWNRAAEVIYGPYDRPGMTYRNILHLVFVDPSHRRLLVDWEEVARASLAMFRVDYARYAGDPNFEHLVAHLTRSSPEFAKWWPRREVARPLTGRKRLDHPLAGRMTFEYSSLGAGDPPDLKLVVFTPLEEEDTPRKLALLLRGYTHESDS